MVIMKNSLTNNKLFEEAGIANVDKEKRYKIVKTLIYHTKATNLSKHCKEKRIIWTKKIDEN